MPLIDSRWGISFAEINPEKRQCQYVLCQAKGKHKACAKCKYARYCSADCQRADWKNHKKVCRNGFGTPVMDAAVWRDTHEDLFKWAAVHALRAHWAPNYMHTHGLLITVLCGDRLHGAGTTPSHFEVLKIEALGFEEITARTGGAGFYGAKDIADSKQIQDGGGLGVALALFQFVAVGGLKMKGVPCVVERYALTERRDSGCARVTSQRELENTVRGHINGVALPAMLERPDAVDRPLVEGVGQAFSLASLGIRF